MLLFLLEFDRMIYSLRFFSKAPIFSYIWLIVRLSNKSFTFTNQWFHAWISLLSYIESRESTILFQPWVLLSISKTKAKMYRLQLLPYSVLCSRGHCRYFGTRRRVWMWRACFDLWAQLIWVNFRIIIDSFYHYKIIWVTIY